MAFAQPWLTQLWLVFHMVQALSVPCSQCPDVSCVRCSLCPGCPLCPRCSWPAVSYTHLTLPTICSV
eukprot:13261840-Alexandrium_andersonii.AAC.1